MNRKQLREMIYQELYEVLVENDTSKKKDDDIRGVLLGDKDSDTLDEDDGIGQMLSDNPMGGMKDQTLQKGLDALKDLGNLFKQGVLGVKGGLSKAKDIVKKKEASDKSSDTPKKSVSGTKKDPTDPKNIFKKEKPKAKPKSKAKVKPKKAAVNKDAKIKNPKTGRMVKVSTALNNKKHPAHSSAKQMARK